jgi:hypothetical protein
MPRRSTQRKSPEVVLTETGVARTWIFLVGFGLFAILFEAAAGSSNVPIFRLLVEGTVLAIWLAAMLGLGAWILRAISPKQAVAPITTAAALGIGLTSLICCGLALAGWLNRGTAWALLLACAFAGFVWIARNERTNQFSISAWFQKRVHVQNWLWLLTVPFLAMATVGAMVPPGLLWGQNEPNGYDVVEYHLQVPREWFDAGRMIPLHHNVFSYFPFNVETHYLLAMHLRGGPYAGMYLAQFMHLAMVILTVLALFELLGSSGLLATLFAATTPWLLMLGCIGYDEGGVLLFGTLAIGWFLRLLSQQEVLVRHMIVAGLLVGFACGCKWSCVPMLLIVLPIAWLICIAWQRRFDRALVPLFVFVLSAGIALSPWLIRNYVWTHNPVFPEAMSLLGKGHFSTDQVARWEEAYKPPAAQRDFVHRVAALVPQVFADWRFGYALFPGAALAILAAIRQRGKFDLSLLFLLLITIGWLVFWVGFTHLQGRFLILLVPVAAMLIARIAQPIARLVILCGLLLQVGLAMLNFAEPMDRLIVAARPILGIEDYSWVSDDTQRAAKATGDVCLIGDATAFFYQPPTGHLYYRTVFDVDVKGRDIIDAWGDGCPQNPGTLVIVNYGELLRFHRTYHTPLPAVMPTTSASQKP